MQSLEENQAREEAKGNEVELQINKRKSEIDSFLKLNLSQSAK